MKILHIGLMVNRNKNIGLSKAFRKLCDKYEEFPVSEALPKQINSIDFVPDITFLQIHNDTIGNRQTIDLLRDPIRKLRESGSFVINWNGDIRNHTPRWMLSFSQYVNLTAFTNQRDIDAFKLSNKECEFLQIGIDTETFRKRDRSYLHDVVFMGNHYGNFPLSQFRMEAVRSLKKRNLGLYGNYPGSNQNLQANPNDPFPMQYKESEVYSCSKIAISISHYKVEKYTSDRLLRAMGSGCFTLAHHYPGIEDQFEVGKHLDTFNTIHEMNKKIDYYLSRDDEREQIANCGYTHVHRNYTYDNMAQNIINLSK